MTITAKVLFLPMRAMMSSNEKAKFSLHIEGGLILGDAVPAAVLSLILKNMQQCFDLIGTYIEGQTIHELEKSPLVNRNRFQLICKISEHGCYAVPVELVGNDLLNENVLNVMNVFKGVMTGIALDNSQLINDSLPDDRLRFRMLESIRSMSPRADAKWSMSLWDQNNVQFGSLNYKSDSILRAAMTTVTQKATSHVVTGTLKNIDFQERIITIIYSQNGRLIDCFYDKKIEGRLIENRRGLIQVSGQVILDPEGIPLKITHVDDMTELDLSPLIIDRIHWGKIDLVSNTNLIFEPDFDELTQLIYISYEHLGIYVFATTRDRLIIELYEQVVMLWNEYAKADDLSLDMEAIKMKQNLLSVFSELRDGS